MSADAPPRHDKTATSEVTRLEAEIAHHRALLGALPAIVLEITPDGIVEYINRILPEYAAHPPMGRSVYSIAPPEQHEVMRAAIAQAVRTGRPTSFEAVGIAPDGTHDWYVTHVGPIVEDGRVRTLALVSTNSSLARQTLIESQERMRLALDLGNMGTWAWDRQLDIVEWDDKLATMFGLTATTRPRDFAGLLEIMPTSHREAVKLHLEHALKSGTFPDYDLEFQSPSGPRWFIVKGGVVRNAAGEIVRLLGGVIDVTERRRIDANLQQLQKLEAIGQLSAGVAHNFNNMLAVIMPALEQARSEADPASYEFLDDALASAANAASLVRDLMVFSRRATPEASRQEALDDVMRRTLTLCRKTFARHIALTAQNLDVTRFARVEASAMEQALMNLLLNARDAIGMSPTREAKISVVARLVTAAEIGLGHATPHDRYVELRISDTGCGMDAATRARMFEPFFTTKAAERGTGLGLATVWATIRAHQGFLECDSTPNEGTTFILLLPADTAPTAPVLAADASRRSSSAIGRGRVVLLVDDEPGVCRANAAVLSQAGFSVLVAHSGDEALRVAANAKVDAAIMDYSMPGLSPQETLAGLRNLFPNLPIITLSGLGLSVPGATTGLMKPIKQAELIAAIEQALATREAS